jgi:hypothetical protein
VALVGGVSGELPRGAWLMAPRNLADCTGVPGCLWMRRGVTVKGRSLKHRLRLGRSLGPAQAGALSWEAVCLGPHAAPHLVLITG